VPGDRVRLQQVFINLMLNGIQAMADIAERPRELLVESRLDASGCMIVAVRDSGTGFGREHERRLFDAFFTRRREGMGIRLARPSATANGGLHRQRTRLSIQSRSQGSSIPNDRHQASTVQSR
jgi:C4-dicarboxylate-specific signal transduction histidine kinase